MNKLEVYNRSSEKMSEIGSGSVDLVFTSPPYNIGTKYGANPDRMSLDHYRKLLRDVYTECFRVLKDDGRLIVEAADSVVTGGVYLQLSGFIQSICVELGFRLEQRHINFAKSEGGIELPEHGWDADYSAIEDVHSNCHQILVFSKSPSTVFKSEGRVMYVDYKSTANHPCPTPKEMIDFISKSYLTHGAIVLDPFMGTGAFGKTVLRRGGIYRGYEIDPVIFQATKSDLSSYASA